MPELIITHKEKEIGRHSLHGGTINIGRGPGNEIPLESPAVDIHHARIISVGQSCHIQDLTTENGTFVNDMQIRRMALHHNDKIHIGHYRMVFLDRDSDSDAHPIQNLEHPPSAPTSADISGNQCKDAGRMPTGTDSNAFYAPDPRTLQSSQFHTGESAPGEPQGIEPGTGNGIEILNGPNENKRVYFSRPNTALGIGSLKAVVIRECKIENTVQSKITAVNPNVAVRLNDSYMTHDNPQVLRNDDQIEFLNITVRFLSAHDAGKS